MKEGNCVAARGHSLCLGSVLQYSEQKYNVEDTDRGCENSQTVIKVLNKCQINCKLFWDCLHFLLKQAEHKRI